MSAHPDCEVRALRAAANDLESFAAFPFAVRWLRDRASQVERGDDPTVFDLQDTTSDRPR